MNQFDADNETLFSYCEKYYQQRLTTDQQIRVYESKEKNDKE